MNHNDVIKKISNRIIADIHRAAERQKARAIPADTVLVEATATLARHKGDAAMMEGTAIQLMGWILNRHRADILEVDPK